MTLTSPATSADRLLKLARAAKLQRNWVTAPIEPVERSGAVPLSFAQQRLWFLEQLGGLGDTYHVPARLRLGRELDRAALRRALDAILARHEALRTTFVEVEGEPVQRIAPVEESRFHLLEHDLGEHPDAAAELRRLTAEEVGAPFDLEHGPLIRGRLLRLPGDEHILLMTMHHIVSDGWSMGVLTRELGTLYAAFHRGEENPLPPLPIQYADYAAWQRKWVDGDVLRQQAEYWKTTLSGAPALLELPTDHPRPARQDHAGASEGVVLDEALTAGLKALSQRHGTTLFMTLLAGWAAVLARLSGQEDVVAGTPSANRGRAEIEGLIGFFINTLALRVDLSGSPTVAELLEQVRTRSLGAQQNQDIPFEQVVELVQPPRSLAYNTLFQVMLTWQNTSEGRLERPGLRPGDAGSASRAAGKADLSASQATAKVDLSLTLWEAGGCIVGAATYATALFERATVERWLGYLRRVLEQMVADDGRALNRLELLDEAERALVLEEWNRTEAELPRTCVHERFEAQVARTPTAVALVFEDRSLTYAELNARANRLAHHLRGRGVGPDARVAVCIERSPELMIAFLAVLKAGGAYVPLDPGDPEERLRHMLDDGAPAALLAHAATAARFVGEALPVIDLDAEARDWADESAANPSPASVGLTPGHLAYVIYTSGSTGRPKGVMVEHRALANVMGWMGEAWPLGPGDVVLQKTPVSFDASARELFPPLLAGARMVIARPGGHRDPAYLVETIRREGVTTLHFVPTMLQFLLEEPGIERCTSIARVVCGGEALPAALARRAAELLPNAELHNVYGPTEAAVDVTWLRCPAEVAGAHLSIGRPMSNCRAYFLDRTGEPVPAGVVGELYLGGVQVARGYLGRAALTAERFVPDAFSGDAGARLYRTGDLGRWKESAGVRECVSAEVGAGSGDLRTDALTHSRTAVIEFLGRSDFQVKVRGFRIELGEIEARLREHEGVREAVVVARENEVGDRRLVAYWVGDAVEIDVLRAHLSGRLPEHMVPAAYVHLDALPLTSNGKLDRKALPAPEGDAYARRGYEAPVGEVEQALAEIWAEVLGVERVGRRDHFFEVGGHSLLAVRLISRVRRALGVEVALGVVFERPVLADLARAIDDAARTELPPIEPADRSAPLPLSFAQQRLWFLEQMGDLGSTYHIPTRLRLGGELDRDALVRTLDRIVERHEALRTTFVEVEGEPVQRIAEASRFHLLEHDLGGHADAEAELRRLLAEEWATPFDLEHGPLIRGRLVRMAEDDHVLLITLHHIVSDGWSRGVLTRELGALYAAFREGKPDPLPALPIQYADYALWQRTWVEGEVLREQVEYWKTTLSGAPALLELPTDHPRPARQDHAGGTVGIDLGEKLTAGLKALGQRHGTTPFMTLLAGWAALLARLSGQEDVVVGTPSANRGRTEIEGLIGFFINTLAIRVDVSGESTVAELLAQVRTRSLGAQQNQDIPFEQVVELVQPVRSLAHSPLFQVMFSWHNASREGLELPGLRLRGVASASEGRLEPRGLRPGGGAPAGSASRVSASQVTAKFDLSLSLWEANGRIVGGVEYAAALFERATVERHLAYLGRVLEAMVADDLQSVDALPLLPEAERRRVLDEWSATGAADPSGLCIHELFEAQVRRTPEAVALVHGDQALTYAQLDARANRLAHHLRRYAVAPEARVGVFLEWNPDLVVSLLAVLKAGGVYVPLDPSLPDERLAYMTNDAGAGVVVTRAALAGRVAAGVTVRVDADAERIGAERGEAPASGIAPESLAYLIYTSGSTGRPKGVAVEHRAAAAHFPAMVQALGIVREDRVLQFASSGFDVSLEQVFVPLVSGAALVLRGAELWSPAEFGQRARALGVTVANLPPAYWQEVLATGALPPVRLLLVGGDALPTAAAAAAGDATRLLNCYGPTEAVVTATAFSVPDGFAEGFAGSTAPIGRPLPGRSAYVLDARGAPVPPGVAGELYLGGLLARGYLGRPGLTAERFVPDPFGGAGARLYRTGDRARWREESALVRECVSAEVDPEVTNSRTDALTHSRTAVLEFLGRADFQVKVRGFRIEPGEIETRLLEHPGVRGAVVVAREKSPGDQRLVAYYTGPDSVEADALRGSLSERLPEYMLPAAYVRLEALPLTPGGKVDRRALPAPEGDAFATRGYEAPVGEMETALAEVWSQVLGVERVGRRDHFFELGGHSLLAVRVISRVRQLLGAEVALADLFERPVLADLARAIESAARIELPPIEPVERSGALALSFAQQRLWFLDHLNGAGTAYHIPTRLRLEGELDREALARALDRIVARHEALRTVFPASEGVPVQRIVPVEESRFPLAEHDLSGDPEAQRELGRLLGEEARTPFDLARGPLIRGLLIRLAEDDHVLHVTMHHIVSDGWSMGVFTRELSALYGAFRRGQPDPLAPLPVQYADYAAWQRRWVEGDVLQAQAEYWTETLAGAPALLELPTDRPRPARQDHAGGAVGVDLGEELTAALKALSQRHGTTLFMTLLAGWAAVLARLSGREDVVVGTPSANRGRAEIEGLIGFFINTLALRVDLSGSPTVAELLAQVRARSLGAQQNQDIPFEQVVELVQPARSLAHSPLFQVMFTWQNASEGRLELPGLRLGAVGSASPQLSSQPTARFDLSLSLGEAGGRIVGSVVYATALFERATAERHLAYLRRVLEAFAADDQQAVDALPLLPEAERRRVVEEWNATDAAYPRELCIHELFEAQVARAPDAVAVVFDGGELTRAELNARANRLAHHLIGRGVGPDARVAVCVERGPAMMVGLLAILKAGGGYVPLDPGYPAERLRHMLHDSAPAAVLTQRSLEGVAALLADVDVPVIDLEGAEWARCPATDPGRAGLTPGHLAYVIYTSGSTGMPKGVMIEHRSLVNHTAWQAGAFGLGPDDTVLQRTSISFDASVWELWTSLAVGARLVLLPVHAAKDPGAIARVIEERGVTVVQFVPTLVQAVLRGLPEGAPFSPRIVFCGGEPLTEALVAEARARGVREVVNLYGPTEATIDSTAYRCGDENRAPAIGAPVGNVRVYVLDRAGEPVPVGVAGELYVGGAGVARGYLNRPAVTAERFVADPFGGRPGARLYRTGDLGRWRPDGTIEFLGRNDFQVKIRGFRVELGEIETRLREHPRVREAVVAAREDAPGEKRLVAYWVGEDGVEAEVLRAHLGERLPEHMVPAAYVRLERLPLTPNGKLDRTALPAPEGDAYARRGYEAPLGETEQALAEVWATVLGVERIGRHDDFFELGGHSLLAIRLAHWIQQSLDVDVTLSDIFEKPVLSTLARHIIQAQLAQFDPEELAHLGALLDGGATLE
jgi:amino acid adenylation domain-containing protein